MATQRSCVTTSARICTFFLWLTHTAICSSVWYFTLLEAPSNSSSEDDIPVSLSDRVILWTYFAAATVCCVVWTLYCVIVVMVACSSSCCIPRVRGVDANTQRLKTFLTDPENTKGALICSFVLYCLATFAAAIASSFHFEPSFPFILGLVCHQCLAIACMAWFIWGMRINAPDAPDDKGSVDPTP